MSAPWPQTESYHPFPHPEQPAPPIIRDENITLTTTSDFGIFDPEPANRTSNHIPFYKRFQRRRKK